MKKYLLDPFIENLKKRAAQEEIEKATENRDVYLEFTASIVGFFKDLQEPDGSIKDPYQSIDPPAGTAYYALAASILIQAGRGPEGLSESLLKSLDYLLSALPKEEGEWGSLSLLAAFAAVERAKAQLSELKKQAWKSMESTRIANPEQPLGLAAAFVAAAPDQPGKQWENILAGLPFTSFGLLPQADASMAHEHLDRACLGLLPALGYAGAAKASLEAGLERGAWTSLLMQSSCGEMPLGGRHSQHQWNEALQCLNFEIWAGLKKKQGDDLAAGMFKRAARLSLQSLKPWQRPSGEFYIVKNYFDPKQRHGYEPDSSYARDNLLTAALLALAWTFADDSVAEKACPAELGGFAFYLPVFHKVISNAAGLYVQLETAADPRYHSTGFLRLHKKTHEPLSGPSDNSPAQQEPLTIGLSWREGSQWRSLASLTAEEIADFKFELHQSDPNLVIYSATWKLKNPGRVKAVKETYRMTSKQALVQVELEGGQADELKLRFPGLVYDGARYGTLGSNRSVASAQIGKDRQVLSVKNPTWIKLVNSAQKFTNRNGFFQVAEGTTPGQRVMYSLRPQRAL